MQIRDAQRELRIVYEGGFFGQLVAGVLWIVSATLATWSTRGVAIAVLVLGGILIFPVTMLLLRILGRPIALDARNPFRALAMQTAFVLPASMLLLVPVLEYRVTWFYPAMMVLVGAHYFPFATLYGMRSFLVLGVALIIAGVLLVVVAPTSFPAGGWLTACLVIVFAFIERFTVRSEMRVPLRGE